METLEYILKRYNLNPVSERMPIQIPNIDREDLAMLFGELQFKIGAEIGVESGVYSETLLANNPNLTLYSIDWWHAYRSYRDHTSQSKLDRFYEETKALLARFGNRSEIWRNSSEQALPHIKDESLDFVYIDANHDFYNATFDIHHWSKKVRKGGIVSGHDYKKPKSGINIHVKQVLQGYTDAYRITPWFIVGAQEKIEGTKRDDSRSWFWVKA